MIEKAVRQAGDELPADVTRAADAAGLGAYENTWLPQFHWKMIIGLLVAVCTVGATVALINKVVSTGLSHAMSEYAHVLLVVPAMALTAWLLADPRQLRMRVFGFAGGLVLRDHRGRLAVAGWDAIAHLRRSQRGSGGVRAWTRTLTIHLHDGASLSMDDHRFPREGLEAVATFVEQRLVARMLAGAEARIAGGGRVEFGDIVLDATGIAAPALSVPWSEVQEVADDFTLVRIRTEDRWRDLFRARTDSTPDVFLLVALTRRLARG